MSRPTAAISSSVFSGWSSAAAPRARGGGGGRAQRGGVGGGRGGGAEALGAGGDAARLPPAPAPEAALGAVGGRRGREGWGWGGAVAGGQWEEHLLHLGPNV